MKKEDKVFLIKIEETSWHTPRCDFFYEILDVQGDVFTMKQHVVVKEPVLEKLVIFQGDKLFTHHFFEKYYTKFNDNEIIVHIDDASAIYSILRDLDLSEQPLIRIDVIGQYGTFFNKEPDMDRLKSVAEVKVGRNVVIKLKNRFFLYNVKEIR